MAILFNQETGVFTLQTKQTAYQMKIGEYNVLLHTYYGKKIEDIDLSYLISREDHGFSGNPYEADNDRTFSLDTLPQEYASCGVGDYRSYPLCIRNSDGTFATDLRYVSHKIYNGKYGLEGLPALYASEEEAQTLEIIMEDQVTKIRVILYYGVLEERDIITRAAQVFNLGEEVVWLEKALSVCMDFNHAAFDWIHFYGKHAMEREMERRPLQRGKQSIGSIRGTSSHQHNPYVILCDQVATEDFGSCYGFSFVYSGNFIAEVEVDQTEQTRLVMGIHPDFFSFELGKEGYFTMPEVVMTYTHKGLGELSRIYHKVYRKNLCRGKYKEIRRPILINNWEATYFDFDADKLVSIAKDSAEIGIEMLVMDDGWFGKRNNDLCGLGDWYVNEEKLGGTLKELVERVNQAGLKFGIWFEPEMISEDSELYSKHPEWTMRIPNRLPNRSRYQCVLDFSRADVREYIYERISNILNSANIEYVKWDMNRSICDLYSALLPKERQGEVYHLYVLGLYELLERLTTQFPQVLFEGCSGGGGRFDAGMLYYMPQIWCSDNTDAIERLKIQYGTSFGYPISSVGSHVSATPNHQTGRVTPLHTRGVVAMAGTFGYELDINKMSDAEKEEMKRQVAFFKKHYDLIQKGDYYRLTNPYQDEAVMAWVFVSEDKSEALISVVYTKVYANPIGRIIKVKGLDAHKTYTVNEKESYSGQALMEGGLLLPIPKEEYEAGLYYIHSC